MADSAIKFKNGSVMFLIEKGDIPKIESGQCSFAQTDVLPNSEQYEAVERKLWPEYLEWLYDHTGCSPSSSDFNYIKYSFKNFLKEKESHIPASPLARLGNLGGQCVP